MSWVERRRFSLLLAATILVLALPAFAGRGFLNEILFVTSMSFLFIQSMIVSTTSQSKRLWVRYLIVCIMIIIFVMEPIGYRAIAFEVIRLALMAAFFMSVIFYLLKFMRKSPDVNINVIITAINIYLIFGIISGSLTFLFWKVIPGSYNIPDYIGEPNFVSFCYYSFVTMSTVGYGDITPRIPQTQTLAYLIAITGQLYVAIIIAFLVGKLLMHPSRRKDTGAGS